MGGEAAAETGFLFSSWLPPSRRSCGRPRRELGAGRPPQPGPVRPGDRRAPAGRLALPSPRRSSADDPRPGRTSSRAAPRTRGPARGLLPGPRGRAEETRGRSGTILAESARARRGSRPPPESPRMRDLWGGCGWKALRWRWAWPVARTGGAVAPRAPSSLAARAAPFVDASPAGARGGRGQRGAALRVWDSVNGAGAGLRSPRARVALVFPRPPDPKDEPAGSEREGPGAAVPSSAALVFAGRSGLGVGPCSWWVPSLSPHPPSVKTGGEGGSGHLS